MNRSSLEAKHIRETGNVVFLLRSSRQSIIPTASEHGVRSLCALLLSLLLNLLVLLLLVLLLLVLLLLLLQLCGQLHPLLRKQ